MNHPNRIGRAWPGLPLLLLGLTLGLPALGQSAAPGVTKCTHTGTRLQLPSGSVGANWINPRNGEQLFHNIFHNQTSAMQSYSQEVIGDVDSTFDGSLALSVACAKVGVKVRVSLRKLFQVNVPPRSKVTMTAYANMMSRSLEMLVTCGACHEVLSVKNNWVTSARGINEYFKR